MNGGIRNLNSNFSFLITKTLIIMNPLKNKDPFEDRPKVTAVTIKVETNLTRDPPVARIDQSQMTRRNRQTQILLEFDQEIETPLDLVHLQFPEGNLTYPQKDWLTNGQVEKNIEIFTHVTKDIPTQNTNVNIYVKGKLYESMVPCTIESYGDNRRKGRLKSARIQDLG